MIDFQRRRIEFRGHKGGPQSTPLSLEFPSRVNRAEAGINGFDIGFRQSDGRPEDHSFGEAKVDAEVTSINNDRVNVTVNFLLRDKNFDDIYGGHVDVLVIVDRV